jgi:hypothetical protein
MTDQVLNILKFILLGLLYLFFARVLWAVWSEVRPPKRIVGPQINQRAAPAPAPTPAHGVAPGADPAAQPKRSRRDAKRESKEARRRANRLVVLEPKQRRGLAIDLVGEITLGRDENCTISIVDDAYVSQLHMRFYDYEGQPMVEDLGSTNGTFHNGNKLTGSKLLHPGDRIQIGTTIIEAQ